MTLEPWPFHASGNLEPTAALDHKTGLQLIGALEEYRRERPDDVNTLCFETASAYELQVGGRKIAGSAQFRKEGARLQHGSIALDYDLPLYMRLLRVPEFVRAMLMERFATKATCLQWELGRQVTYDEMRDVLTAGFQTGLGLSFTKGALTPAEEAEADRLVAEKYGSDAWNFKR